MMLVFDLIFGKSRKRTRAEGHALENNQIRPDQVVFGSRNLDFAKLIWFLLKRSLVMVSSCF